MFITNCLRDIEASTSLNLQHNQLINMFKLLAIFALLAAVSAAPGFPLAYHHAPIVAHAPVLTYAAPVVKPVIPLATSYAHQYRVDYKAPIIAAPVAYAYAPYAHASYAHAPILKTFLH